MPALRLCLGTPGRPCNRLVDARRCPECATGYERGRTQVARVRRPYTSEERARRAAAVARHVEVHGWWCPGWGVPPHASQDLTADHVVSVAAGGREDGELAVLCRPCNGRKGSHPAG